MKEKAIIFSDYRQPYNFLSHEDSSPVDSSTPLPGTSKYDSYPRRHKRPFTFNSGQPGTSSNLRKHNSESNLPMDRLFRRRGNESSPRTSNLFAQREGSILEETLEESQADVALASPSGSQRATVSGPAASSALPSKEKSKKKKFWRRKSKDSLDLQSIQEGEAVTPDSAAETESPKKKKKFFGKKERRASPTSPKAPPGEEATSAASSGQQTQNEADKETAESADELNAPMKTDAPAKKKKFWKRRKSGSQASLDGTDKATSQAQGDASGDDGITGATGNQEEEVPIKQKKGSILRRLSKSGSRSSLSKSEESLKGEQVSAEEYPDSPRKRRSSLLGRLSKSGSRSSLSKSEDSIEGGLGSAEDNAGTPVKQKSSMLRKLSKSGSRRSSRKSDDIPSGTSGQLGGGEAERGANVGDIEGEPKEPSKSPAKKGSLIRRLSRSGSKTSLSRSEEDLAEEGSITPRKKKGLFGKKKTGSRTSLNKPELDQP